MTTATQEEPAVSYIWNVTMIGVGIYNKFNSHLLILRFDKAMQFYRFWSR